MQSKQARKRARELQARANPRDYTPEGMTMSRQQICIGNPHALRQRVTVTMGPIDVLVPVDDYDNAMDCVISQLVLSMAGCAAAMADIQSVVASLAPLDVGPLIAERSEDLQAAVARLHAATAQVAAARAGASQIASTPA